MRRLLYIILPSLLLALSAASCDDDESYAEMKNKERKAINSFVKDNDLIGSIKVISESAFLAQDSTTDVEANEFVLFNEDGIYMQIVRKGAGKSMREMALEKEDSTVNFRLLCRFLEYDIENADTTYSNIFTPSVVDKLQVNYSARSRSYTASFTEGYMKSYYGSAVPEGWLKPLDYIRLTRSTDSIAKVRLIVPHSSGTSNAANYVLPYYYEISYERGL